MNGAGTKVIGYVRVSTNKQDVSPDVQIAALGAEADRRGWELEIRQEEAASAKSVKGRPVLAQALADLKAGRADVLAVSKLDRLSRNLADFAQILDAAEQEHWHLVCLDLQVDTTTITGRAMAQVTCTFAEMERRRIAERTREATARIRAEQPDKVMGRRSVLSDDLVQRIHDERGAGLSMARIAEKLNAEGVPTATGKTWHASTIRQVLSRPAPAAV